MGGYAAAFGLTAPRGMAHSVPLPDRIQADERAGLGLHPGRGICALEAEIDKLDANLWLGIELI